jgi:hypothetical protein
LGLAIIVKTSSHFELVSKVFWGPAIVNVIKSRRMWQISKRSKSLNQSMISLIKYNNPTCRYLVYSVSNRIQGFVGRRRSRVLDVSVVLHNCAGIGAGKYTANAESEIMGLK